MRDNGYAQSPPKTGMALVATEKKAGCCGGVVWNDGGIQHRDDCRRGTTHTLPPERTEHELKTWEVYWDAIADGRKTFELRYNDRGYQAGDILLLKRWNRERHCATSPYSPIRAEVTYVMSGGQFGLKDDWVCMGLKILGVPK